MIDPKYSLKYSFPHSLVHIVDNSMYTGETVTTPADDPSVFSTIVVTGLPMGVDNKFVTVNRSDVLNTGFGVSTLTSADTEKYSQAIEYPMALLQQNVPVKLMRITPEDATYAMAVIMVQWKKKEYIKNNKFEVRFKVLSQDYINTVLNDVSEYKNVTRLNKALVTRLNAGTKGDSTYEYILLTSDTAPTDWATNYHTDYYIYDGTKFVHVPESDPAPTYEANKYYKIEQVWNQRVFMTVISAGRGAAYNRMRFFINKVVSAHRQPAVTYNFGTIDTLNGLTIENFTAALVDTGEAFSKATLVYDTNIDSVNLAVGKRIEGSSVLVPTVDESAVKMVFNEYMAYFKEMKESGNDEYVSYGKAYDAIYERINVAKFDMIYGMFTYDESVFKLPYYQVDMYDSDIPKLPENNRVKIKLTTDETETDPPYTSIAGYGATISATGVIEGNVDIAAPNAIFEAKMKQAVSQVFNDNSAPAPGDIYLAGVNSKNPYLIMVTGVNLRNGAVTTMPFTRVYDYKNGNIDKTKSLPISKIFSGSFDGSNADIITRLNNTGTVFTADTVIICSGIFGGSADYFTQFQIWKIREVDETGKITSAVGYPSNIYAVIDYGSNYLGIEGVDAQICRKSCEELDVRPSSFSRLGSLYIDDESITYTPLNSWEQTSADTAKVIPQFEPLDAQAPRYLAYFDNNNAPVFKYVSAYAAHPVQNRPGSYYTGHTTVFRAFYPVPSGICVNVNGEMIGEQFDLLVYDTTLDVEDIAETGTPADYIFRCNVQSSVNNTYRVTYASGIDIPGNYYVDNYGDILYYNTNTISSTEGGVPISGGSTGFFDDDTISTIEFKWRYSALLVKAFRGEIDPRILSPVRIPAFFLFDAGFNTVVGMNVLPYTTPNVDDVIYASTIFTDEEKESALYDRNLIKTINSYEDIDVKQAMYDLMIERVYQRIPEENRPIGPGSGLSLHLDAGITSAETAIAINNSFKKRFDNPNASWDIGGYVSSENGVAYTYLMQIIRNCFNHYRSYTINKPYVGTYSSINREEYLSFFPDLDATDWEMRELYYKSGGNAWIMDVNGNLTRRSQRSLYREETGTSDLYQESNMRTLSQFVYLIQSEIDNYLLEYNDDGVIKTLEETVNNKFSGWAGNLVQSYDITFYRDINTDGGDILVCNVNVVFRGLILRVPIIVNVNRRTN